MLWPKLTAGFTSAVANSLETEYNKFGVDGGNANIGYISFLIWVSENVKCYLIGINASRKAIKIARLPLSTLFSFLFSFYVFFCQTIQKTYNVKQTTPALLETSLFTCVQPCWPVGAEMVAGTLLLRPLSALMLMVYSMPGVRPLRVWVSELPGITSSALWPSAEM